MDFGVVGVDEGRRPAPVLAGPRGHVIRAATGPAHTLFLVGTGRVVLARQSAGRRLAVAILGAGALVGESALLGESVYGADAVAAEPCTIRTLSRTDIVRRLRSASPLVQRRLLRLIGRLHRAETRLEDLAFRDLSARLASTRLRLARPTGQGEAVAGEVVASSHRELAAWVGAHRASVTTMLDRLEAEGTVTIRRRRVYLRHPDRLRQLARAG
jgi:CRP/FNR family transcriptional regulator